MNGELTEIIVIGIPAMAYKSNQIPRTGDILHFPHFGGFRVKNVVYRIADDSGLDGNRLMWVELFVEKYEETKHEERKCEDCDYSEPLHWEQDKRTGRAAVAGYWCDKHQRRCDKPCKDFLTEVSE